MIAEASNFVGSVDTAFIFIVAICVFFLVLITGLMITFVIKYSRKRNPIATNIHGSVPLEVTWTLIPTILVLIMFWFGWTGYKQMTDVPKDAMVVDVTGQMWKWSFKYENGVETDTLFVPLNKPVRLNLHSKDVNHSFYVPAFKVKKDVIPNRNNHMWFKPEEIGSFNVFCAEYCGLRHSYMLTKVIVMPKNDFDIWLGNAKAAGSKPVVSENDSSSVGNQ